MTPEAKVKQYLRQQMEKHFGQCYVLMANPVSYSGGVSGRADYTLATLMRGQMLSVELEVKTSKGAMSLNQRSRGLLHGTVGVYAVVYGSDGVDALREWLLSLATVIVPGVHLFCAPTNEVERMCMLQENLSDAPEAESTSVHVHVHGG